jgi:RNA polymerase sigma-70 factor (ECF subfamily)
VTGRFLRDEIAGIRAVAIRSPKSWENRSGQDDTSLMRAVGEGSVEAFSILVDRHSGALYRVAARMGRRHEAEDVVQECFVLATCPALATERSGARRLASPHYSISCSTASAAFVWW